MNSPIPKPALELLQRNRVHENSNDLGYITPSRQQYFHLWLWDACFHSMLLTRVNPKWAMSEMRCLLEGQWEDGRIPHIQFRLKSSYRPSPEDWQTGRSSSGITQPPVVATALRAIFETTGDLEFLKETYSATVKFHRWLRATRDSKQNGLVTIVHPWESGTDNSPCFDSARNRLHEMSKFQDAKAPPRSDLKIVAEDQRPKNRDYLIYWGLIQAFQELEWDGERMGQFSPFKFVDLTFNSLWTKANEDLAFLAESLSLSEDASLFSSWCEQTREAMRNELWSDTDSFFYGYDQIEEKQIQVRTHSAFLTLFAGIPTEDMALKLVKALTDEKGFWGGAGIPSTAFDAKEFDPVCYWRGPVWINFHYLIAQGLRRYGFLELSRKIARFSEDLVSQSGYREYYHPYTKEGLGAPDFSWSTLAHIIDSKSSNGV
ncbi:hypothetical protein HOF92_11090 [bacterium]|nr:hypothetical protein [bacterium]